MSVIRKETVVVPASFDTLKSRLLPQPGWQSFVVISAAIAMAYFVSGWLGLQLAVPPGYATVVWPASGIAIAAVLLFGPKHALGVFVGAFALNASVGGAFGANGLDLQAVAIAAWIAAGSSLQAVAAFFLVRRLFGIPIAFGKIRDVGVFALVTAPFACVIAASVGTATLRGFGLIASEEIGSTWLTWWSGDAIGVLVALPLGLFGPWRPWSVEWAGRPVAGLRAVSLAAVVIVLGLTFYAWKTASEAVYARNLAAVETSAHAYEPAVIMAGGMALSLLLGLYLLGVARREEANRQIAEQKTRALAANEAEMRAVVETAVVSILSLDERGNIVSANATTAAVFGYTQAELTGNAVHMLLGLPSRQACLRYLVKLAKSFAREDATSRTVEGAHKSGARLLFDLQLTHWTTASGEQRYTAILRDITAQHEAQRALAEAEERWSIALSGGNIGVFDIDLTTGTSVVSQTWRDMLGIDADTEVDPQKIWDRQIHPDDLPAVQAANQACLSGLTERSETEYRIQHTHGYWMWLRSDAMVTARNKHGEPLRFVGTQTDITDLKNAEAALKLSEQRLGDAIDNAPIGMGLVGLDGHWFKVNEAMCNFIGYSPEELMNLTTSDLTHPDDVAIGREQIERLLSGEIATFQIEKRYVHKQGHTICGLLSMSVERDGDGRPVHFIKQILDITERMEMDKLKREFISNVSHELRTPLTSIRGSLGLVVGAKRDDIPEKVMRLLTIAHFNSERLILLINDILDMEKLAAEKIVFDIQKENVADELRLAVQANRAYAEQFGVTYTLELPEGEVPVHLDKGRLQQVLANLMSNAAKFSPKGGDVEVALQSVDETVCISVTDHGSGIPSEFQSKIFTPFSQADGSSKRTAEGTGLGLHIAKQMTERMGGRLWFETAEGEGTTFFIAFPRAVEETTPTPSREDHQLAALHVESDQGFSAVIGASLGDTVHVENVPTLAAARQRLEAETYDLLILDIGLEDGNGLELIDSLPKDWQGAIVVLTADEDIVVGDAVDLLLIKSKVSEQEMIDSIRRVALKSRDGLKQLA